MAEWSKAPDCNSGDFYLRRFESFSSQKVLKSIKNILFYYVCATIHLCKGVDKRVVFQAVFLHGFRFQNNKNLQNTALSFSGESRAARSARQAHDLKVVGSNPTSLTYNHKTVSILWFFIATKYWINWEPCCYI